MGCCCNFDVKQMETVTAKCNMSKGTSVPFVRIGWPDQAACKEIVQLRR